MNVPILPIPLSAISLKVSINVNPIVIINAPSAAPKNTTNVLPGLPIRLLTANLFLTLLLELTITLLVFFDSSAFPLSKVTVSFFNNLFTFLIAANAYNNVGITILANGI